MSASIPPASSSATLPLSSESRHRTTTSTPSFESGGHEQGARLVRYNKGIPEDCGVLEFDECTVYIRDGITRTIYRDGRPDKIEEWPLPVGDEEPHWTYYSWDKNTEGKTWYDAFKRGGEDSFWNKISLYDTNEATSHTWLQLKPLPIIEGVSVPPRPPPSCKLRASL